MVGVFCFRFSTFKTFSTDPCLGMSAILFLLLLLLFVVVLLPPKKALLSKSVEPKFFRSCTSPWLQLRPTLFLGGVGCKGSFPLALPLGVLVIVWFVILKFGTLVWKLFTERAGLDALELHVEVLLNSGRSELCRLPFCGNIVVFRLSLDDVDDDAEFESIRWFSLCCSSSMIVSGMCPANLSSVIRCRLLWLARDISFTDSSFDNWWLLLFSCCVVVAGDILLL